MRIRFFTAAALAGALIATGTVAANDRYKDASRMLVSEASMALKAEKSEEALVLYERALVADPANLNALIGLGKTHEVQGRVGRGLKYYRQALAIDPNAQSALEAQAVAFLKRDMVDRAEANRDKLARLCSTGCRALETVRTALDGYKAEKASAELAEANAGRD